MLVSIPEGLCPSPDQVGPGRYSRVSWLIFVHCAKLVCMIRRRGCKIKETRGSLEEVYSVAFKQHSNEINALDRCMPTKGKCLNYFCIAFLSIVGHGPKTLLGHFKQTH